MRASWPHEFSGLPHYNPGLFFNRSTSVWHTRTHGRVHRDVLYVRMWECATAWNAHQFQVAISYHGKLPCMHARMNAQVALNVLPHSNAPTELPHQTLNQKCDAQAQPWSIAHQQGLHHLSWMGCQAVQHSHNEARLHHHWPLLGLHTKRV